MWVYAAEDIIKREEIPESAVKLLNGQGKSKAHPVKAKPVKPKKKHSPIQKVSSYSLKSLTEQILNYILNVIA